MTATATTRGLTSTPASSPPTRWWRKKSVWIWGFLTPTIVLYGFYTLYPIIGSYWYSLVEWNGFDAKKTFIGIQNYRDVLADPLFWNAFKVTAIFVIVAVPIKIVLTLGTALLLNSPKMPLANLFRTMLFLPVVTTTAIVGIVMQMIFDPASGPVNQALVKLGLIDSGVSFLADPGTALWTVIAVDVWKWFGITMVYWLAALQTIPRELYEAAWMDGAGVWATFKHVTFPLLKPFAIIISLLELEGALKIFDLMLTMTNGGPFYSTEVVEIYIYRWAFAATVPQLGYASAAAVTFGIVVCAIGTLQLLGVQAVRKHRAAVQA